MNVCCESLDNTRFINPNQIVAAIPTMQVTPSPTEPRLDSRSTIIEHIMQDLFPNNVYRVNGDLHISKFLDNNTAADEL